MFIRIPSRRDIHETAYGFEDGNCQACLLDRCIYGPETVWETIVFPSIQFLKSQGFYVCPMTNDEGRMTITTTPSISLCRPLKQEEPTHLVLREKRGSGARRSLRTAQIPRSVSEFSSQSSDVKALDLACRQQSAFTAEVDECVLSCDSMNGPKK